MSTLFSGHYLRNRSTLDIGVLGYIGIVQHKEHPPEVLSLPPGTSCIFTALSYTTQNSKVTVFGLRTVLFWVITQRVVVNPFLTAAFCIRYVQFYHLRNYVTDGDLLLKGL